MNLYKKAIVCCLFAFVILPQCYAQDSLVGMNQKNAFLHDLDDRNWQIKIPLWLPGFTGTFAYGSVTPVPEEFDKGIYDRLEKQIGVTFYLIAKVSYKPKSWLFEADGFHAVLAGDLKFQNIDGVKFNATIEGTVLRGFAGYRVFQKRNSQTYFNFKVYAYGGMRYFDIHAYSENKQFLDVQPTWFEPIVGLKLPLRIKKWEFSAQFDLGGFGLDNHWSTHSSVNAGYRFTKVFAMGLGWSALDFNYGQVFRDQNLDFDIALSGPVLGLQFNF